MPASFQPLTGIIRFGPDHYSWRSQDPATGSVNWMCDLYDYGLCHLFSIYGSLGPRPNTEHRGILRLCESMGFSRMQETNAGQHLETDLLARPFRRRAI